MFAKWKERKALRKVEQERQRLLAEVEKKKHDKVMSDHTEEMRQSFMKSGIHPFDRSNINGDGTLITMYGILNGRIVKGTTNEKGGFHIEYLPMP